MSKFKLGQVVMTRGIASELEQSKAFAQFVTASLKRHATGDWGEMCKEDLETNEQALIHGDRLFSAYEQGEWKIWIITEWDRSYTTILFPSEY